MNTVQKLNEFIDLAEKNRKYPKNSVYGYRAAIKLLDGELNEDENDSLELFKDRFEQIYSTILQKKKNEFSMSSLEVYRRRILKILSDYQKYGIDPSKMSGWSPAIIKRTPQKLRSNAEMVIMKEDVDSDGTIMKDSILLPTENSKHEYSLRPSKKIIVSYPSDFTLEEAKSIQSFAAYLVSMRGGESS